MDSREIRAKARKALSGNWGIAVLAGLIAALLGAAAYSGSFNLNIDMDLVHRFSPELVPILTALTATLGTAATAVTAAHLILGGVIRLGYCRFNLRLADGKSGTVGDLFAEFGRFLDGFLLNLLTTIFVVLWSLLLVIPGIVASYRYAMAPYIMQEDPDCSAMEALRRSKAMMDGHKGELFWLDLTFIGWGLLSVLTLGIGSIFLVPYQESARAVFYRELQDAQPRPTVIDAEI